MSLYNLTQTGLIGVEQGLQAASDNLANEQTIGYKSEDPIFETLLGDQIGSSTIGGGVITTGINSDYSDGSIESAGSPTDMAIQGNGFFIYEDSNGAQLYSRNGQVSVGPDGTLVGANGDELMGFQIDGAGKTLGTIGPLPVPQGLLPPVMSTKTSLSGNLNSADPVLTGAIDPTAPATYSYTASASVIDSQGNSHVLTFYFQNTGADPASPGDTKWNWTATLDGSAAGLTNNSGAVDFDSNGAIALGGIPASPLSATLTDGAGPLSLSLDLTGLTQFASADAITGVADGSPPGNPTGVQISSSGLISETYSNGLTQNIGQVALATFANNQGLQLTNGGMLAATPAAGPVAVETPGSGSAGAIQSSSLEESNVNTSTELVNLITLESSYGANAKALQVENTVDSTIVNLQIR